MKLFPLYFCCWRPTSVRNFLHGNFTQQLLHFFYKLILIIIVIILWLKSYPKYTIDRDIADNADKNRTRNSSGDEIANVNFLYDDIVHMIQNTIESCINSATARRGGYVLERMFTKFSKITQCNGHYAVQGHSRSPILHQSKAHIRLPISD